MKFGIITHTIHKIANNQIFSYEPYVREMNLWSKYVKEFTVLAPLSTESISKIENSYQHQNIKVVSIPIFNITSSKNILKSLIVIPKICWKIFMVMKEVDHIHLRCPGNIGLLGCLVQILFPSKPKTVKYAGNWDPNSKQPLSYRLQKMILSNTFLTRNCKVLVYGKWENQSNNIIPFFTASYRKDEIEKIPDKSFNRTIRFVFVGTFSEGKQPFLSVKTIEELKKDGLNVRLDMYGDGALFDNVLSYIKENSLEENIFLYGNQSKEIVKRAFQKAHFLIFVSKSEGWPKVVAEAMFWGCLPVASQVSCIPYMLDEGERGILVKSNTTAKDISKLILEIIQHNDDYKNKVNHAKNWSQQFTLDSFEKAIKRCL